MLQIKETKCLLEYKRGRVQGGKRVGFTTAVISFRQPQKISGYAGPVCCVLIE